MARISTSECPPLSFVEQHELSKYHSHVALHTYRPLYNNLFSTSSSKVHYSSTARLDQCVTMKTFAVASLSLLITSALAAPFDVVSKRPLASHEWVRSSNPLNPRANCPALLPAGEFEFPHYITQISASEPDKAFGNQYNGVFTPNDISSIFSFDIPASRADANCTLEFIFPKLEDLKTSTFTYSGGGNFIFEGYNAGSCPGE